MSAARLTGAAEPATLARLDQLGAAQLERARVATLAPLAETAPDLERDAGAGYVVRAYFRPDLARAKRCAVLVSRYGATVDTLDVPAADGLAAWRHTATVSDVYRDALTARPDAAPCEVGA